MSPTQPDPDGRKGLLAELRRRRVFRVTGAYVLVAWILMQAGEIVFPAFELSNRALRLLILSLAAGLPVVVLLAWLLDVSPRGIRLTERLGRSEADASDGSESGAEEAESYGAVGRSLEIILLGMGLPVFAFATLFLVLSLQGEGSNGPPQPELENDSTPSLAVLPLEDLSAGGGDAGFFSRGMHEDILTQLARVHPLKLISRTSVMAYEGTTMSAGEIGRQLGVDHLLEGSVRRTPTHVRVTAQLIDVATDEHVWAEQFDAELEDVFEVQSRIARSIARALEAELVETHSGETRDRASVVPAAYDAYLKARDLHRNLDAGDREALERTQLLYEEARRLDPKLAPAWLQLGILHAQMRWFGFDLSRERIRQSRSCLDRAASLGIADDQLALAEGIFAYYVDADYGKALLRFDDAARLAPGNPEAAFYGAMILRRSGALERALEGQRLALELDPLNLGYRDELALTLALTGRLEDAKRELDEVLGRDPNRARAQLQRWQLALELWGRPDRLLEKILASDRSLWTEAHHTMVSMVAILAGRPEEGIEVLRTRPVARPNLGHRDYQLAVLEGLAGRPERKQRLLVSGRARFQTALAASGGELPGIDARRIEALFAAQSGDFDMALALLQRNAEMVPVERDLIGGSAALWDLLHVQLQALQIEDATRSLERLTSHLAIGTIPFGGHFVLERWPEFEAARQDPRWRKALDRTRPDFAKRWAPPEAPRPEAS